MHLSFGIEPSTRSTRWADVVRGPSKEDVIAHVQKIGSYQALVAERYAPAGSNARSETRSGHLPAAEEMRVAA